MNKINFKRILPLVLCLAIIAPVFNYNIVLANNSQITSFGLIYNDGDREINLLAPDNNNHVTVRASKHVPGFVSEQYTGPVSIDLRNVRFGAVQNFEATWKAGFVRSADATVRRGDEAGTATDDTTILFNMHGSTDTVTVQPSMGSVGRTIILEIWVTHFEAAIDGSDLTPAGNPQGAGTSENSVIPGNNRANFTIATVTITVADDRDEGALGANISIGAMPVEDESEWLITPPTGAEPQRIININNVFIHNFNAPDNMQPVADYQWRVDVTEGNSVEVEVPAPGGDRIITGEMSGEPFTQSQKNMTVRARNENANDNNFSRSGESTVTIQVRRTVNDPWQRVVSIKFKTSAQIFFDIPPVLISPGSATALPPLPEPPVTIRIPEPGSIISLDVVYTASGAPAERLTEGGALSVTAVSSEPDTLFEYQWFRLDANHENQENILFANASDYIITDADVGWLIGVYIIPRDDDGDWAYWYANTPVLADSYPAVEQKGSLVPRTGKSELSVPSFATEGYFGSYVEIPLTRLSVIGEDSVALNTLAEMVSPGLAGSNSRSLSSLTATVTVAAANLPDTVPASWSADAGGNFISRTFHIIDNIPAVIGITDSISLYIPLDWINFNNDISYLTVSLEGSFTGGTAIQPVTKTVTISKITADDNANNGSFVSFKFDVSHDSISSPLEVQRDMAAHGSTTIRNTLIITTNRDKDFETVYGTRRKLEDSMITLNNFKAAVYSSDEDTLINDNFHNYTVVSISLSSQTVAHFPEIPGAAALNFPSIENNEFSQISLTGDSGTVTVTLSIRQNDKPDAGIQEIRFNIEVRQVGVFASDEGNIISLEVRRVWGGRNSKIPVISGAELEDLESIKSRLTRSVFLKSGTARTGHDILPDRPALVEPDSMTVNINNVIIQSAAGASSNFSKPLNNFDVYIRLLSGNVRFPNALMPAADITEFFMPVLPSGVLSTSIPVFQAMSNANAGATFTIAAPEHNITGETESIIEVTVVPMIGTGDTRDWAGFADNADPAANKPVTVYFRVIVNELGGNFDIVIDYDREVIMIEEFNDMNGGKTSGVYTFDGNAGIKYMYALKAVQDGVNHKNEKWLPVMGSEIDISKLVPRNGEYRLAVRSIDASMDSDGFYSEGDRRMKPLGTRRSISSGERRSVSYDNGAIKIASGVQDVLFRVGGTSEWATATLGAADASAHIESINVSPEYFPLGGTIEIRFKPAAGSNARFASPAFKLKIPKTGSIPKIKENLRKGTLSGFSQKMSWSDGTVVAEPAEGDIICERGWKWNLCSKGAVPYKNLTEAFPGLQQDSGYYNLYIRTDATAKNPPSAPVIFKISEDKYITR